MSNNENKSKQEEKKSQDDDDYEEIEVDDDSQNEENEEGETGGEIIDKTVSSGSPHGHGKRRRVKIKKRIRIKKKTSSKRKYKKIVERIIWIVFIVGFILSLYYLLNGLGISDQKYKSTPKGRGMIFPQSKSNHSKICAITNKQNQQGCVTVI